MILFIILSLAMSPIQESKSVYKNNMKVEWNYEGEFITFKITALTEGWVAIGFNTTDQLTGTNLIMGTVKGNVVEVEDQYIVKPGDHRKVSDLGGTNAISQINGSEPNGFTTIQFTIPIQSLDNYHFGLLEGIGIQLLMAYSREDDFRHHSVMRTSVKINL